MQPQPIPHDQQIGVWMTVQQWDTVLRLLHEVAAPLRVTAPIVQEIQAQCLAANVREPAADG